MKESSPRPKITIAGITIDNVTMAEALAKIDELIVRGTPSYVVTPNVDHIVKLNKDIEFKKIYDGASLVVADGVPLLWAGLFLGTPFKEKVSGSDLLPEFCRHASLKGHKIFFLGGDPGSAERSAEHFRALHPGIRIVGTYCPPYGFEHDEGENDKIVRRVLEKKPDVLFVGLGAPKQERWIARFKDRCQVPVSIGVGISFSFASGDVKRAAKWMQDSGLEWLWRLIKEPRRLWRRYLLEDPVFFWLILKQKYFKSGA